MPVTLVCQQCSADFRVSSNLKDKAHFCSRACKHTAMRLPEETRICASCEKPFLVKGWGKIRAQTRYCSRLCGSLAGAGARKGLGLRTFWDKVQQCGHEWLCPYCCWPFQGGLNSQGYGRATTEEGPRAANRVAWELSNERRLPDELFAAHYCHFRPCCNPMHIHAATQKENMADSVRDQRQYHGQRHHQAKLTPDTIKEAFLLRQQGWIIERIADHLGVSYIAIQKLLKRETWKSIDIDALLASP